MAANRKKGKKPQNSNQSKSSNTSAGSAAAVPVSDNATSEVGDPVAVNREVAATSAPSTDSKTEAPAGSTAKSNPSATEEADPTAAEVSSKSSDETKAVSSEETDNDGRTELSTDAAVLKIDSGATETVEPATPSTDASPNPAVGAGKAPPSLNTAIDSRAHVTPGEIGATPASKADAFEAGENAEAVTKESSEVKLSATGDNEAATPPTVASQTEAVHDVNFVKDEIRTLLVPVNPFNRLVAAAIVIFSYSILGYIILKTPAGINAQGMHTIDLPEAGDYVLFFRGETEDAYGWTVDGRFRKSLEIDMEPVEPHQKVVKIEPIKDLSGANFFSVAEYEVNQPGKYNLWIKWTDPNAKCKGKIQYEKDPVETFFFKWALGIVGTIAFFYMLGIPLTTRKAQATLPNSSPPVVPK